MFHLHLPYSYHSLNLTADANRQVTIAQYQMMYTNQPQDRKIILPPLSQNVAVKAGLRKSMFEKLLAGTIKSNTRLLYQIFKYISQNM